MLMMMYVKSQFDENRSYLYVVVFFFKATDSTTHWRNRYCSERHHTDKARGQAFQAFSSFYKKVIAIVFTSANQ